MARLAGSARHALPSVPALAYGALLYHDESSQGDFSSGIVSADGASVAFAFQTPSERSGLTLEVFAFADGTERADFSREGALLCGKKEGLSIEGNKITAEVSLLPNKDASAPEGTVSLKVKVPLDCGLEIDDTTNFAFTDDSPDADQTYTVTQKADGISGGAYALTFTVKKGGGVVHVFSEHINVFPGMVTDTWSGLSQGEAREVTQAMLSTTVYVRGAGGWYDGSADFKDTAAASDDNPGSLMRPFATIQKAVDTIIARNDRSSAYTILVDGTLDGKTAPLLGEKGMADFSALDKNLNLTIMALDATKKATLDGGARLDDTGATVDAGIKKSVIYAKPNVTSGASLSLTLESLVITGGNTTTKGGGIYIQNGTCIVTDCEISSNKAYDGGGVSVYYSSGNSPTFTMTGGTISDNKATNYGGGIYSYGGTVIMNDGEISHNTAEGSFYGGGGVYMNQGKFEMKGGKIIHNTAKSGGGVNCQDSTFIMSGAAEISDNTASNGGGVAGHFSFTMRDEAKITNNKALNGYGGGVYNSMGGKITGGEISGNEAKKGGGVYLAARGSTNPETTMTGGTISGNTATDAGGGVYVSIAAGKSNTLTIGGTAEVSGNTTTGSGGGIYVENKCALNMNAGEISGNTATKNGGGVFVAGEGLRLKMTGGTIGGTTDDAKNKANCGGGVYIATTNSSATSSEDTFQMEGGKIVGNEASADGGGFYVSGQGRRLKISGGTVGGNTATGNGGGMYADGSYPTLAGGEIRANKAASGGGIYINMSTLDMTGGTVGDNTATGDGSGVYASMSTVNLGGGALVEDGNDIYSGGGTIKIASALTQAKVAAITLPDADYTAGKKVILQADSSVTIDDALCKKFAVNPQADGTKWRLGTNDDSTAGVLKSAQTKFYVRGTNAPCYDNDNTPGKDWYGAAAANDTNDGSVKKPFATIQKAIDTVLDANDETSEYTIYADGTLTLAETKDTMAFVAPKTALKLKIVSLHPTQKATLDAQDNAQTVIGLSSVNASINGTTTLERLVVTGGKWTSSNNGGGAGINISEHNVSLVDCDIKGNTSTCHGGGIYTQSSQAHFSMKGCMVSGNTAYKEGGGMYLHSALSDAITIEGCTFSGNKSNSGGGIYYYNVLDAEPLVLKNCTVSDNKATSLGGGIYSIKGTILLKDGSKVKDNVGGGIATSNGSGSTTGEVIMEDGVEISGNTGGCGVCVDSGFAFTMNGGIISGNTSVNGGGVFVSGNSTFTMNGGTISGNTSVNGGGVYVNTSSMFTMTGGTISGNKAENWGGGVQNDGTFIMDGGTIASNIAVGDGGGVHVMNQQTFTMNGGIIIGNTTSASGGGVALETNSTFTMNDGTISGNIATTSKNGVYEAPHSTFNNNGGTVQSD